MLLAHLVGKFTDQGELVSTEALAYVLKNSIPAREGLQGMASAFAGENVEVARVGGQVVVGTESRPDLAAYDKSDSISMFIEAKFWASLTTAQPGDYLRRLAEKHGRLLLFVVPHERLDSLRPDIQARAGEAGFPLGGWEHGNESRVARSPSGLTIGLCSWSMVLRVLREKCVHEGDQQTVADLDQLVGMVTKFESDGYVPMSRDELTDLSVPRRIISLVNLCDDAVKAAEADDLLTTSGLRPTHSWYSHGRYAAFPEAGAWIGLQHMFWAAYHVSPLWMYFGTGDYGRAVVVRQALASWELSTPRRLFIGDNGGVAIPLLVDAGAERDAVVRSLVLQARQVRMMFVEAGMPVRPTYRLPETGDQKGQAEEGPV